eukprot:CAMPEP_0195529054 /NCGR_PEP_ID=MMETSP0794_2-20130614/31470_1 /TAXON_ID=515487 /ORGANISM="Stephanopyxis turris, Strain CCMP 815" /LENGTH=178 /DNA_ID=CAMNT_0040660295 /DNA_START=159 /DNA_END=695 /DNA_ORIENTATION=-
MTEPTRREVFIRSVSFLPSLPLVLKANCAIAATTPDTSSYVKGSRGLEYLVIQQGNADHPKLERSQKAGVIYTLTVDGFKEDGGKEVDNNKGWFSDGPMYFYAGVGEVMKGVDLTVLDMEEGEKRRVVIPPSLGYGDKGAGRDIPGGSTLYFEVELVEIGEKVEPGPDLDKWLKNHPL